MFWFIHPKPFSQKPVAMHIVQRKTAALQQAANVIVVEKARTDENAAIPLAVVTPKC